jgi:RHS repeat-associated protein
VYEHLEYTPYGELWVDWTAGNGVQKTPFRVTGKELDEETGLYYYGARYLDPKTSRWLSADPAVGDYVPVAPVNDEARKHNQNLPGMGGVFNYVNLHVYHYAGNNPVKYIDPDGEIFETGWDLISLGMGALSFATNIKEGNFVDAAIDLIGIAADTVAVAVPGVPGGIGFALNATRNISSAANNITKLYEGIKKKDAVAIAKASAGLTSIVLSTIAGRGFGKAADYSSKFFTKYEQIGDITSAAATLINGGVLTHDIISTVKGSLERNTSLTFSDKEVEKIITDYAKVIQQPIEP